MRRKYIEKIWENYFQKKISKYIKKSNTRDIRRKEYNRPTNTKRAGI